MLSIDVPRIELWDSKKEEFSYVEPFTLKMEHSLYAVSKWEARWHKAFFTKKEKTAEEVLDYFRCMALEDLPSNFSFRFLRSEDVDAIDQYTRTPMTATYISSSGEESENKQKDTVTSELIYFWMFSYGIPMDCQYWNIGKLFALLHVFNVKTQIKKGKKKTSKKELIKRYSEINETQKKLFGIKE